MPQRNEMKAGATSSAVAEAMAGQESKDSWESVKMRRKKLRFLSEVALRAVKRSLATSFPP